MIIDSVQFSFLLALNCHNIQCFLYFFFNVNNYKFLQKKRGDNSYKIIIKNLVQSDREKII